MSPNQRVSPPTCPCLQACSSLDCDIISLDMTQRLTFKLRPQHLSTAVKRGVQFEVGG